MSAANQCPFGQSINSAPVTVTTASTPLLLDNRFRKGVVIYNSGATLAWLSWTNPAVSGRGIPIAAGAVWEYGQNLCTGPLFAASDSGTTTIVATDLQ